MSGSDRSSADDGEVYEVEKILDTRLERGKKQYFIKWKNYPASENTWEPSDNVDCPDLIEEFERALKEKEEKKKSKGKSERDSRKREHATDSGSGEPKSSTAGRSASSDIAGPRVEKKKKETATGFDRKLIPAKILGATDSKGELMFLLKWEGNEIADLVPSKEANVRCPQIVIKFYEERLTWQLSGR